MISAFFTRHFSLLATGLAVLVLLLTPTSPIHAEDDNRGESGLPLPRFVSIKGNPVNLRQGPGTQYHALLTFRRVGWPVEILDENSNWRKVRDYDGDTGWIQANLLRGKRSVVMHQSPTAHKLRKRPDENSFILAYLQPGVIAELEDCEGEWCDIRVEGYRGWISRVALWGVNPNEFTKK